MSAAREPTAATADDAERRAALLAVAVCFFLSGAAALTLEVVWSRSLRLVFGSTTLAVSTVLVAYMLGLGLGGLAGGRIAARLRSGVRTYGWIEIAIGVYAMGVPTILALLPRLDVAALDGLGFWGAAGVRFVAVLAVLLLPTVLMGATLPILTAAVARQQTAIASRVGLLYGINTLGAVTGVLVATFVLFPAIGVWHTNLVGALAAIAVGIVALTVIAPRVETGLAIERAETAPAAPARSQARSARWSPLLLSYGVVGFTALAYEVCWTRALAMVLGSSVYAFATMLAAFLLGIAFGSLLARRHGDRLERPQTVYALGVGLLGLAAIGTIVALGELPRLFVRAVEVVGTSAGGILAANVGIAMLAMLAPTLVLGALFPILLRALAATGRETSGTVGDVYFVNTVGCALGAFAAGFVLIPGLGLQVTMALLAALNLAAAAALLLWQRQWTGRLRTGLAGALAAAAVWVLAAPPAWQAHQLTRGAYLHTRFADEWDVRLEPLVGIDPDEIIFYREGINTTVSLERRDGSLVLRVNGKPDASSHGDLATQVLLGQLPMLFGGEARRAMVIGLASGITVGAAALHEPDEIDVIELEPAMVEASRYFDALNYRPLDRPGTRVVLEDGRIHLARRPQPYEVIISEPSNPWISGVSNLFTVEFFGAAREALTPDGRLLQWVQMYGLTPDAWRSILAALQREFPHLYVFLDAANDTDSLVLASVRPLAAGDIPRWEHLSDTVRRDLQRIGTSSTADLWSLLRLGPDEVAAIAAEAPVVNSDDNMYVELTAPRSLHDEHAYPAIRDRIAAFTTGALPHLEAAGVRPSDDEVGELALSYATRRGDGAVARATLAQRPGMAAYELALEALLRFEAAPAALGEALQGMDQAIAMRPDLASLRFHRGSLRFRARAFGDALDDIDAFLASQPEHAPARALRARLLFEVGRHAEARDEAGRLIEARFVEHDRDLHRVVAAAAHAEGDLGAAIASMLHFLEVRPNHLAAWQILHRFASEAGDRERIEQARENIERTQRNLARGWYVQALRHERRGDTLRARDMLRDVVEALPEFPEAHDRLRRIERRLGAAFETP